MQHALDPLLRLCSAKMDRYLDFTLDLPETRVVGHVLVMGVLGWRRRGLTGLRLFETYALRDRRNSTNHAPATRKTENPATCRVFLAFDPSIDVCFTPGSGH